MLPDWLRAEDWTAFREHRTRMRKPMTAKAARLNLDELAQLREQGHEPAAVIAQSIKRGWVGLFPIKADGPQQQSLAMPARREAALQQRNAEHAAEFVRRMGATDDATAA